MATFIGLFEEKPKKKAEAKEVAEVTEVAEEEVKAEPKKATKKK